MSEPDKDSFVGRAALAVIVVTLLLGALLAACGGSSTPKPSGSATPASPPVANSSGSPSAATFDFVVSGGLQVEWKNGADSVSGSSCSLPPTTRSSVLRVMGSIGSQRYELDIVQAVFGAGTFTYPVSSAPGSVPSETPLVEITTVPHSPVFWTTSNTGDGNGTVTISGGGASPVSVALDLDLAPRNAQPVHVKGTLQCPTVGG
jgi:hypothetical protein